MIEGGLDRPGQNHILKNIVASGGKTVFITPVVAFNSTSPAHRTWTEIDLSAIIPVGAIGVLASITLNDSGTDNFLTIDKNGRKSFLSLIVYVASEMSYSNSNSGAVECDADRKIGYYVSRGGAGSVNQCSVFISGYVIPVAQR